MRNHTHLAFCYLLSSMFFHAYAIQQEIPNHTPGSDAVLAQDANRALAELSALTQDGNPAEIRRLCGSRNCGSANCGCTPKNDCCTKLQCRRIITTLDVIESKVCLLTECEPIPLSPSDVVGGNLTIDESGSYCLCCDITALISITASQVTLDMNCHQVIGSITIASNQDDIDISNGVIDATGQDNGINVSGPNSNIQLSRLTVQNSTNAGILSTSSTNLFISDVLVENSSAGAGMSLAGGNSVFVSDSVFFSNNSHGFSLETSASTNVIVTNCQSISNGGDGFNISSVGSTRIYYYNCTASQNIASGFGASVDSGWSAFDCVAEDNGTDGFALSTSTSFINYLEGCLSKNNMGNGFNIPDGALGTLNQCTALNNTIDGFNDAGGVGSSVKYISNSAQGNTTLDYDPAMGPPLNPFSATAAGISYWYNTFNT